MRLFELIDAEGRRPIAQAAVELDRQCEIGRATLTEREHQVFSKFVLGEVGEELRRRLSQANSLISAMNTSLKSIRTSHGIGVRLTWKLSEDASGDITRIKDLVTTAAAVRTFAQDAELTSLLSARVAAEAVKDPTAGYAIHLRSALDCRSWHTVEVIITGPEAGRERRISRRAKLSQGETRFVSYVTLFAAIDAYLSGLENTLMSLRLILLDDAFAKVDEPTVAELLGLLVRLDVDFAMTGHAPWGCVPQVPALDIYEICREDGTPRRLPMSAGTACQPRRGRTVIPLVHRQRQLRPPCSGSRLAKISSRRACNEVLGRPRPDRPGRGPPGVTEWVSCGAATASPVWDSLLCEKGVPCRTRSSNST